MKKNVKSVKNSLKFKAQPKSGVLSVRVGVKKYTVPVDARILTNGDYIFLSFPACSELFRIEKKELHAMGPEEDATDAYNSLNPGRKRGRRKTPSVTLPSELAEALRNIPPGYKLGYDLDGTPRLVRRRNRGGA
jgi:hypothetical protein